ncbi:MAG: NAD-dependent epimerase/dehydratase family protein [Candidatus Aquicultor sp.]
MKLLVTGAAGDIASQLIPSLIRQGHSVRALVRSAKEARSIQNPAIEIVVADITIPKSISGTATGMDAVFHLAAALFVADPEEDLRKINYEGTINMANECIAHGVKRFIFPSFPLVLGPHSTPSDPINPEDATTQPNCFHALYKKLCEQHLLVLAEHGKLSPTILRLGTVYGPDMRLVKTLKSFIKRGLYRIPGDGAYIFSPVHIDDVVQAMLLALNSQKAIGQIYNVADDMPVRYKEFVFMLADLLGAPKPRFAPVSLYRAFAGFATLWARLTDTAPLINNDILTFSTSSFAANTTKTKNELGFKPNYPTIAEGLPTCIGRRQDFEKRSIAA